MLLSYEQIGQIMFVEIKTVYNYFEKISKKLNIKNRNELILFSLQNGHARIADYTGIV
jgi:DNA-binding CsgD family transcriptional regulator